MKKAITVDEFILNAKYGKEILLVLRNILKSSELNETVKWGMPVYTFQDKNIVGFSSFKFYTGLWFYQGAFLKDEAGVLINAQENTTKAMRQWRFNSVEELDEKLILQYIHESIQNQKMGLELKPDRNKPIRIPDELKEAFAENRQLENCFKQFTTGRQREFADYVSSAKQEETRKSRVQKIIPLIRENIGLNDKYRR